METVSGIGGVFFRAKVPSAVANWYSEHLGIPNIDIEVWNQEAGPTVFTPFGDDTDYWQAGQQWMVNFRVHDLDAMIDQLRAAGIEVETRPDEWDSEVGRFARIQDPEGTPIELWEPTAG